MTRGRGFVFAETAEGHRKSQTGNEYGNDQMIKWMEQNHQEHHPEHHQENGGEGA